MLLCIGVLVNSPNVYIRISLNPMILRVISFHVFFFFSIFRSLCLITACFGIKYAHWKHYTLVGYSDRSHKVDMDDGRSTTGHNFILR